MDGWCAAHRPGGKEELRRRSAKGGRATKRKYETEGFDLDELVEVSTLEDAKLALDQVRKAVLTRKVTHNEANSASKAIAEWVKTESARYTSHLVTELQDELAKKGREIDELRTKLGQRTMRAV